jgi:metallophosphoesterase (TIGR00282 family)
VPSSKECRRQPHFPESRILNPDPCPVRILHIGDIVGKPGRRIVVRAVRALIERENLDLVIANAENAAGGSGLTPEIYRELIAAGVHGITLGDHIYRRREICDVLDREPNIVKPANYPPESPGREFMLLKTTAGEQVAVISLMGRVFMRPVDCPFAAVDRVLAALPADVNAIVVDFHAEATSDKQLMGRYLDGKVSAVLGTHTHVATADAQIYPGGTAFQCDVGMTGPHESIIGRRIEPVMEVTRTFFPEHFDVATGDVRLCGAIVEVDATTRRAKSLRSVCITEAELEATS